MAGQVTERFRRVFHAQDGLLELHLSLLQGVGHRYRTPFFSALQEYSRRPTGVFHALPISQGKSIVNSHWIGDMIDVRGTSKGKGFAGVMKRHNFKGAHATHAHEYFRHGGSIGQKTHPGKVFPGMRMPGHMGDERVTVLNLKIVEVNADKNLVVVAGAVPGSKGSLVYLRAAVKKPKKS